MSYLDSLPKDLKNELGKYEKRMKLNDEIFKEFCHRYGGRIMYAEEKEIGEAIDNFNKILQEANLLSNFEIGEYQEQNLYYPYFNFNEKDIITDEFLIKFVNYFCEHYPDEVRSTKFNYWLDKLNSPFRIVEQYNLKKWRII